MDTKTITTPIKKCKVVVKEWITGGEYEDVQKPITGAKMLVDLKGNEKTVKSEINVGEVTQESTDIAIKIVVISIDGETKDIIEKVKSMHKNDYLFVINAVDEICTGENFPKP